MPHPDFGRTAFLLGPGGMAEGPAQAVQVREFLKAGIEPDDIIAVSVGAFNGLDLQKAFSIWRNNFTSPWNVYDLHPEIKKILEEVLKNIPHFPFHRHTTYKELFADLRNQFRNLIHLLGFLKRAGKSVLTLPLSHATSPKDLTPVLKLFIESLQAHGLDKIDSILDPTLLIHTLRSELNLEDAFTRKANFHIFAHSGNEEDHVFVAGSNLPIEAMSKVKPRVHHIKSAHDLLRAAMASAALRPFFKPVTINGGTYWDVGMFNPFPAEYAIDLGCDTIFAFVKNYRAFEGKPNANLLEAPLDDLEIAAKRFFLILEERAMERKDMGKRNIFMVLPQPLHPDQDTLWISPEAIDHADRVETEATRNLLKDKFNLTLADD